MASTAASYNPSRDDFAAMLDESFAGGNLQESSVIKGKVVAIEKDMAVIDVGLKSQRPNRVQPLASHAERRAAGGQDSQGRRR